MRCREDGYDITCYNYVYLHKSSVEVTFSSLEFTVDIRGLLVSDKPEDSYDIRSQHGMPTQSWFYGVLPSTTLDQHVHVYQTETGLTFCLCMVIAVNICPINGLFRDKM